MPYSQFTSESALTAFGLALRRVPLHVGLAPAAVPAWLPDTLARGARQALVSEKSRSEFIVAPVLLAAQESTGDRVAVFSGQRLDVDGPRGLSGECDFILALDASVPVMLTPIAAVVEAKKNDIDVGLGQCIAQLVGAREYNAARGGPRTLFGCVTTGEAWQFLRLEGDAVELDAGRLYLDNLGGILAAFGRIVEAALVT